MNPIAFAVIVALLSAVRTGLRCAEILIQAFGAAQGESARRSTVTAALKEASGTEFVLVSAGGALMVSASGPAPQAAQITSEDPGE